jgi:hypothetical protein
LKSLAKDGRCPGHDGYVPGYQASLFMNPKTGVAVIVLANVSGSLNIHDLAVGALDTLSK